MKSDLCIRPAQEQDCPAIMNLIQELAIFENAEGEVLVSADDLKLHAFGPKIFVEMLVATHGDEVVGAALFYEKYSTWKGPALHLEDLIVNDSWRGQGIGAELLAEVLRIAASRNYRRVYWQVLDWNQGAIRFYERYKAHFDAEWINVSVDIDKKKTIKS